MRIRAWDRPDPEAPAPRAAVEAALTDLRFRRLVGNEGWASLPEVVRQRFGKRLGPGLSANYAGQVLSCRMNFSGWVLAQVCRLIGAPLPLEREGGGAAVVSVTEDGSSGGQIWTRVYARKRGFPQVIHSAKRFAGPTGLEEYLGGGFGIALSVSVIDGGIRFSSDHYFVQLGSLRLRLPWWFAPGLLTIDHVDIGDGTFTFTLNLSHRLLGEMMRQHSCFSAQTNSRGEQHHD